VSENVPRNRRKTTRERKRIANRFLKLKPFSQVLVCWKLPLSKERRGPSCDHFFMLRNMMDTAITVRCLYCFAGVDFKPMAVGRDGRFVCDTCGHTARPGIADYHCHCMLCWDFAQNHGNIRRSNQCAPYQIEPDHTHS